MYDAINVCSIIDRIHAYKMKKERIVRRMQFYTANSALLKIANFIVEQCQSCPLSQGGNWKKRNYSHDFCKTFPNINDVEVDCPQDYFHEIFVKSSKILTFPHCVPFVPFAIFCKLSTFSIIDALFNWLATASTCHFMTAISKNKGNCSYVFLTIIRPYSTHLYS